MGLWALKRVAASRNSSTTAWSLWGGLDKGGWQAQKLGRQTYQFHPRWNIWQVFKSMQKNDEKYKYIKYIV